MASCAGAAPVAVCGGGFDTDQWAAAGAGVEGRGLHAFIFHFNLSRFRHKIYPTYPLIAPDTS